MSFIIGWLGEKFGKVWGEVILWALIAAAIAAPFFFTYYAGKSNCENAVAQQQLKARVETLQVLSTLNQAGAAAVGDYVLRRAQTVTIYQTIREEVPRATSMWKPSPAAAAEPLPMCVFTRGFVGVWNDALEAGHDTGRLSEAAGRVAGAAAAAGPVDDADLLDAGISRAQLLNNHIANGDALTACEQRFDGIVDWERRVYGDVK